jgi:hypothetical protein
MSLAHRLAFVGLFALAAGCSGYGNSGPNSAGLPCGAPKGSYALVYPAPGATAIPDALVGVVFGSTNGLSSSYQAILQPSGSLTYYNFQTVTAEPSPLPTPNTIPSFANPIYQISTNPGLTLPAATQVSVYFNDGNSNCSPTYVGSFTTQ